MIFITLLLYLVLLVILRITGVSLLLPFPWYAYLALFIISAVIVRISFAVFHSFHDELIPFIRNICFKRGIRQYFILVSVASAILIVDFILNDKLNLFRAGFLIPVAAVSLINFFGFDYLPRHIFDDDENPPAPDSESPPEDDNKSPETEPQMDPSKMYQKHFRWNHEGTNYSVDLQIRPELYEKFSSLVRVDYHEWAKEYVSNGICSEVIALSRKLMQTGKPENTFEEVSFVLAFTQGIVKYTKDEPGRSNAIIEGEYPKYPVETLVEEKGDCEDSSILTAALLKSMGYDSALIYLPGHCALGVAGASGMPGASIEYNKTNYYYCETTAEGWKIGQLPSDYNNADATILPVPNREFSSDT